MKFSIDRTTITNHNVTIELTQHVNDEVKAQFLIEMVDARAKSVKLLRQYNGRSQWVTSGIKQYRDVISYVDGNLIRIYNVAIENQKPIAKFAQLQKKRAITRSRKMQEVAENSSSALAQIRKLAEENNIPLGSLTQEPPATKTVKVFTNPTTGEKWRTVDSRYAPTRDVPVNRGRPPKWVQPLREACEFEVE